MTLTENKETSSKAEEQKASQLPTRSVAVITREPSQRKTKDEDRKPSRPGEGEEAEDPSKAEEKHLQEERVILKLKLEIIEESVTTAFENRMAEDNKANLRLKEHHITQLPREIFKK